MEKNRISVFQDAYKEKLITMSYPDFIKYYFSDNEGVSKLYSLAITPIPQPSPNEPKPPKFTRTIGEFYLSYACDLVNKNPDEDVWGDGIQYCKAKPTPEQEALAAQIKFIDDNVDNGSFNGGEVTTYNNGMKVYDKIIGDKAFRFFPPNKNNELKYFEYLDDTFTTDYYSGTYSLSGFMPESINESIKRWLDIMNKTSRVIIKEQTIVTRNPTKNNPEYARKQQEIKTNADIHSQLATLNLEHFSGMPWSNETQMIQITKEVKDLIGRGWRGLEFTFFLDGLKLKGYTKLYDSIKPNNELAMTNPTDAEQLSGDYEEVVIKGFRKPVWNKRGSDAIQSTDSKNFNETNCAQALADFYKGCGGKTNRSQVIDIRLRDDYKSYIKSKAFFQKKEFILACDSQGFYTKRFKNTGDLKDMTKALMSTSTEKDHPGKDSSGRSACQIIFTTNR